MLSTDDWGWATMPTMLRRISRFCSAYRTEIDPAWLTMQVKGHFLAGSDQLAMWAVLDGDAVVGHVLCLAEHRPGGRKVAFVLQIECDTLVSPNIWRVAPEAVRAWARSIGAGVIETSTWLSPRTLKRYGFTPYRTVARMEVGHGIGE